MAIEVMVEGKGWDVVEPYRLVVRCLGAVRAETGRGELERPGSALFTTDQEVRALNRDFRGKAAPTNVLSFPAEPLPGLPGQAQPLGDLALAYETCIAEAQAKGITPGDHAAHLIVHGLLHLLGYDHQHDEDAEAMEETERRVLARLGIGDPYGEPA